MHAQFEQGTQNSSVPLGENVPRAVPLQRSGVFEKAAGQATQDRLKATKQKTGYAWGDPQKASDHVKKAFEGAAGSGTGQMMEHQHRTKKMFPSDQVRQANEKNFHRGIVGDKADHGVIDYHPTSQGERARAAPKRKSQVKALIQGDRSASLPEEAFHGKFEAAYEGAAGVSAGSWADARYASTTAWN